MGNVCSGFSTVTWSDVDKYYFVLYIPTVGYFVCCDISAGLKRPTYLLATCYIGLFFNMCFSTFLIPLLQCPIMPYNLHDIYICHFQGCASLPMSTLFTLGGLPTHPQNPHSWRTSLSLLVRRETQIQTQLNQPP